MIKTIILSCLDNIELKKASFRQAVFPTHFHDTYSIGLITKGVENISLHDQQYSIVANTFVIFNQYELHANSYFDEDEWSYETIHLNIDFLRFISRKYGIKTNEVLLFSNIFKDDFLRALLLQLAKNDLLTTSQMIEKIACHLLQHYQKKPDAATSFSKYTEWRCIVEDIKHTITTQYSEKLVLEDFAAQYKKSSFQILRAFKSHVGISPIEFQMIQRINRAKKIIQKEHNITRVALECGFSDHSHFTHAFKKFLGVTPSQYRDNIFEIKA